MQKVQKVLTCSLFVLMLVGAVQAQEAAVQGWNGAYIGAHAGFLSGDWKGPLSYDDASLYPPGFDYSEKKISGDSWFAGLQTGYDLTRGRALFGIAADVSWTDLSGQGTFIPYPLQGPNPAWNIATKLDMFGTLRGRLGALITPSLLFYGTGGFAWGRTQSSNAVTYSLTPCGSGPCATGEASNNHLGWAAGGGAEWQFAPHWSLSGEYLFIDLGRQDYGFEGTTAPYLGSAIYGSDHFHPELTLETVRLGINYRFGAEAWISPLK